VTEVLPVADQLPEEFRKLAVSCCRQAKTCQPR